MRRLLIALLAFIPVLVLSPSTSLAATSVECGIVTGYVAPDSLASTDGSLTFGIEAPLMIAASAAIDATVASNLPMLTNSAPTCLALETDTNGTITSLAFAPEGEVCGPVVFDTVNDIYVVANRVGTPSFVLDVTPELAALMRTAEASGNDMCLTVLVDPSGLFDGYRGQTAVSGVVTSASGQSLVQGAVLTQTLLSPNALAALTVAESTGRSATVSVSGSGTVDLSTGVIDAAVSFNVSTEACATVRSISPTETVVNGTSFAWSPSATIGGGLGVPMTGVGIVVDADGTPHLRSVALPGCADDDEPAVAAVTPPPATVVATIPTPAPLLSGRIPVTGAALLVVNVGAAPIQVVHELQDLGCNVVSVGVTVGGGWRMYVPGAPAFVNQDFPGQLPASTPFAVRCH